MVCRLAGLYGLGDVISVHSGLRAASN
uniref:Uncharacterized protein n=1 Tax=Arundo donax TaxID=35708 RepID=A0A0A8YJU8_ARUDO